MISREEIQNLLEDYAYNDDIMNDEDERVLNIKYALSKLSDSDRIIFLLQTDIQSQRKVGEILGISHSTVGKVYNSIKAKIIEIMNNYD